MLVFNVCFHCLVVLVILDGLIGYVLVWVYCGCYLDLLIVLDIDATTFIVCC